jgi:hypothetical protein
MVNLNFECRIGVTLLTYSGFLAVTRNLLINDITEDNVAEDADSDDADERRCRNMLWNDLSQNWLTIRYITRVQISIFYHEHGYLRYKWMK